MRCHQARRLFFLYHDSELDPRGADEVNLHLESCPECRELWSRERRLEDAIARAAVTSAGPLDDFRWSELETKIAIGFRPTRARRRWIAAAALSIGLALAFFLLDRGGAGPSPDAVVRSAVEHHEKYVAGNSPVQVRGPEVDAVRSFYAGELGFDVLVPDGPGLAEALGAPAELVGARRCTFAGGPVAYVTYRVGGNDVTVILGPLKPPEAVMEAISRAADGRLERTIEGHHALLATVRGVLFAAVGRVEPGVLRGLLERFQMLK